MVRFMLYLLPFGVLDRAFLKLLDESLSLRSILGFAAGVFFLGWVVTGVSDFVGFPADTALVWPCLGKGCGLL